MDFENHEEFFDSAPDRSKFKKHIYGIWGALLLILHVVDCQWSGYARLRGSGRWSSSSSTTTITGTPLWIYSFAIIALALGVHFHFFWGNDRKLGIYHQPLKIISFGVAVFLYLLTVYWVFLK